MAEIWQDYATVLAINFAVAMGAVLILWALSIPLKDVSIIDMAFALVLLAIAATSFTIGGGSPERGQLILLLVAIWALRITTHLVRRNWGHGEDARYTKLRSWVADDRAFVWLSLKKVFLLQGIVLWLVSLPIQVAQIFKTPAELGWLAALGALIAIVGIFVETIADLQLTRFRRDPVNKGKVLDTGLWRYSRHPNYFGELCFWWGLFVIALENPIGWFTVVGPLAYTYLIVNVTGQRTLDKKLAREKPAYKAYMETTSGLIPLPRRSVQ